MSAYSHSVLCLALVALVAPSRGEEQKVPLSEVSKAVLDAVKAKFPHAELKEATKEKEDDETIYEIRIVDHGKKIDVSVDDEGEIEETETEVAIDSLPKPARDTLQSKFPHATIQKTELIVAFEDGKEDQRSYEVEVVTDAKKTIEVTLTPEGKIVEEESKGADQD